ncbi:hypothetical protein X777_07616 [Ooceraea biroi]|uniref:Uncharacterized protein n=1 Tax=Ooceraea biroi TaxID=2015173 RepID=A0A026X5Q8_OOCBI|nr:hypothetical protein X777_07616 [Ooceraea biroi]
MVQVVAETGYQKTEDLQIGHEPFHLASFQHREHRLRHVQRVPPIVMLS